MYTRCPNGMAEDGIDEGVSKTGSICWKMFERNSTIHQVNAACCIKWSLDVLCNDGSLPATIAAAGAQAVSLPYLMPTTRASCLKQRQMRSCQPRTAAASNSHNGFHQWKWARCVAVVRLIA